MLTPNEGERPSRLQLDRIATGELPAPSALSAEARAHLDAVSAVSLPPLDIGLLRRRASQIADLQPLPRPANRWRWGLGLLAAAAVALLVTRPPAIQARGSADLLVYEVAASTLRPYDGGGVGPDTDLVVKVRPDGRATVVVFGVDGTGTVSQYWPESGDAPEPLGDGSVVDLPGSLRLDDTPGDEVLVAVFDSPAGAAHDALHHAFASGGLSGVRAWAHAHPDADAVVVSRASP